MMDSSPIAHFLESTYPDPPVVLSSELGTSIEAQSRAVGAPAFRTSIMPREANILSTRSAEYFRRTREAALGHPLEELLDDEKEERAWKAAEEGMRAVSEMMLRNSGKGPFILGAEPSYSDFRIVGSIQSARMVDEGVFERLVAYPGYRALYEGCAPFMERRD